MTNDSHVNVQAINSQAMKGTYYCDVHVQMMNLFRMS